MAKIKVHAGKGFNKGNGSMSFGQLSLPSSNGSLWTGGLENVPLSTLRSVTIATEDRVKKMVGSVGWGVVGAVVAGPLGALAGILVGGNKKEVLFIAEFSDGRQILAATDSKTFTKLQATVF